MRPPSPLRVAARSLRASYDPSDVSGFAEAWLAGKAKTFADLTPRGTPPAVWNYIANFHKAQPEAWADGIAALKRWKRVMQEERRGWQAENKTLPRREKTTWAEHLKGLREGEFGPHTGSKYMGAADDRQLMARLVSQWWRNSRSGTRFDPMSAWRRASTDRVASRWMRA